MITLDVESITSIQESQLSADHIGSIGWPVFITDSAPSLIVTDLHSSLVHSGSSHQPEVSIVAEYWGKIVYMR